MTDAGNLQGFIWEASQQGLTWSNALALWRRAGGRIRTVTFHETWNAIVGELDHA